MQHPDAQWIPLFDTPNTQMWIFHKEHPLCRENEYALHLTHRKRRARSLAVPPKQQDVNGPPPSRRRSMRCTSLRKMNVLIDSSCPFLISTALQTTNHDRAASKERRSNPPQSMGTLELLKPERRTSHHIAPLYGWWDDTIQVAKRCASVSN